LALTNPAVAIAGEMATVAEVTFAAAGAAITRLKFSTSMRANKILKILLFMNFHPPYIFLSLEVLS
jgi:hypothetical protein